MLPSIAYLALLASLPSSQPKITTVQDQTPPPAASTPSQQPRRIRISGGVMAGNRLTGPNPEYPAEAKQKHMEGSVVFAAVIGEDGTVRSLQVVSGPPMLAQAAWDAVKQWTYKPFLLNGTPVEVNTTITVNFHLPASSAQNNPGA